DQVQRLLDEGKEEEARDTAAALQARWFAEAKAWMPLDAAGAKPRNGPGIAAADRRAKTVVTVFGIPTLREYRVFSALFAIARTCLQMRDGVARMLEMPVFSRLFRQ
ncbi:MAG TPA: hypothetical protein VKE94_15210, partial [Gemmataceae bacterium]|nr:hypothetical protein [Gemmataceae bacterium]